MNAALSEKKIRLGEVAAAIGTTSKALSHWLNRYSDEITAGRREEVGAKEFVFNWATENPDKPVSEGFVEYNKMIKSSKQSKGWTEFSLIDVAHLSLTKTLVDYGIPANTGYKLAVEVLSKIWQPILSYRSTPPAALVHALHFRVLLLVLRDGEVAELRLLNHSPGGESRDSVLLETQHGLFVNLAKCVGAAFKQLSDMGHDASGLEYGQPTSLTQDEPSDE